MADTHADMAAKQNKTKKSKIQTGTTNRTGKEIKGKNG